MPRTRPLVVEWHIIDVAEGGWCDRCALPSVCVVDLSMVDRRTLRVMARRRHLICRDCGEEHIHPR